MNPSSIFAFLFLCILFVGHQSGVYALAIPSFLFALWILMRQKKGKSARLKRASLSRDSSIFFLVVFISKYRRANFTMAFLYSRLVLSLFSFNAMA